MTAITTLLTPRLILRPISLDDAQAYHPLVNDPQILEYTTEQPLSSLAEVRELLRTRPLADYQRYGYGRLACIERHTGRLIGFSGLKFLDDLQQVDVGYRFLPDCWGKGYATESSRAVIEHGFQELGLSRIIGLVMPQNTPSARVLQKVGLHYEKRIRVDDCNEELDLYATSRAE